MATLRIHYIWIEERQSYRLCDANAPYLVLQWKAAWITWILLLRWSCLVNRYECLKDYIFKVLLSLYILRWHNRVFLQTLGWFKCTNIIFVIWRSHLMWSRKPFYHTFFYLRFLWVYISQLCEKKSELWDKKLNYLFYFLFSLETSFHSFDIVHKL